MRLEKAKSASVILDDNGHVHYPFSKFLSFTSENPHTQESISRSLRLFFRFLTAHNIELAVRAIQGKCLGLPEMQALSALCWRPLDEIELMKEKKVVVLGSIQANKPPKNLPNAVESNTARERLLDIAAYLRFYLDFLLLPLVISSSLRIQLQKEYEVTCNFLKKQISGTKQSHPLKIQSLPTSKFLQIIREFVVNPEQLFQNQSGGLSRTIQRDRAMALLACEGVRPGALGNIILADFRPTSKHLVIKDNSQRRGAVKTSTPVQKLARSTKVNNASEIMIELWPWTVSAISEYIESERSDILEKKLINSSKGFLFLSSRGEPIGHRGTITYMFNRLGKRLAKLKFLEIGDDPYFYDKKQYDFYAYVLRHSSATFYHDKKVKTEADLDTMKIRFGWTQTSSMPQLYAARSHSDRANIDLADFNEKLMSEVAMARVKKEHNLP